MDDLLVLGQYDEFGRHIGTGGLSVLHGSGLAAQTNWTGTAFLDTLQWKSYAFQAADFDGDGHADVLQAGIMDRVGRYSGYGAISVRSGGLSTSSPLPTTTVVATNASAWALGQFHTGDFDGDGRADLLVVGGVDVYGRYTGSGCLTVRYGGLPLAQSATVACDVGAWNGYIFKVGDFDGDGRSDLIGFGVMDQYGRYTGSGGLFIRSGGVSLPTQTVWSGSVPSWVGYTFQLGDFDADLRSDVLGIGVVDTYGRYSGSGALFIRRGGLTLPTQDVWTGSVSAWTNYIFHVGDFDGDSRSDVLGIGAVDTLGRYSGSGGLFVRSGGPTLPTMNVWASNVGAWVGYTFQVGNYVADPGTKRSEVVGVGVVDAKGRYVGSGGLFVRSGGPSLANETVISYGQPAWTDYRLTRRPTNIDVADNLHSIPFFTAIADLNRDGWVEPLGSYNDKTARWFETGAWFHGLQSLLPTITPGRAQRDSRVADFTGDGFDDVISNTYSCPGSSLSPNSFAKFHRNNGDGTFTEVPNFISSQFAGRGETIVAADFDNDGDLEAYLPVYTYAASCPCPPGTPPGVSCGQDASSSLLLNNNGNGFFQDVAVSAGVGLQGYPGNRRPEGAQAADFNSDGWIDLYVAGHLFINNKNLTFTRRSVLTGAAIPLSTPEAQLAALPFDEGMKFLDWNNDGQLDIALVEQETATPGLRLYQCPTTFPAQGCSNVSSAILTNGAMFGGAFGINAYDLDNNGREDLLAKGGTNITVNGTAAPGSAVFLNNGSVFSRNSSLMSGLGQGGAGMALGDFNRDGKVDIAYSSSSNSRITRVMNALPSSGGSFSVEVLGPTGLRNQHGRVIKVTGSGIGTQTRVVDGGSGYMAQNQYEVLIGTPASVSHSVTVVFAPRHWLGETGPYLKQFSITPGSRAKVYAPSPSSPTGSVQILPALPPAP